MRAIHGGNRPAEIAPRYIDLVVIIFFYLISLPFNLSAAGHSPGRGREKFLYYDRLESSTLGAGLEQNKRTELRCVDRLSGSCCN